jgi:hypothetical protein
LQTNVIPRGSTGAESPARPFSSVLLGLIRRPQQILFLWNWKSAVLSVILRGPIFLVAGLRHGWKGAVAALFTEAIFCVVTAGFYGAIVQSLKDAEPQWLTAVFLAGVMPVTFQVLEYVLHWFRGTPHLRVAEIVSLVVSAISSLFNLYAMRRGTLLVGGEGANFGRDLARLPLLLLRFFALVPRKLVSTARTRSAQLMTGLWCHLFPGR